MRTGWRMACAGLALACAGAAQAQTYRCSAGGAAYYSDRPCAGTGAPASGQGTKLSGYGPATRPMPASAGRTGGGPQKTEAHVNYLRPECASISEAIRTGPSRGVKYDVLRDLQEEYREKCDDDDQAARRRVQEDRQRLQQAELNRQQVMLQARNEARLRDDQCANMRDVIGVKRRREAELNEKEVAALRSLEKTYNDGCLAR